MTRDGSNRSATADAAPLHLLERNGFSACISVWTGFFCGLSRLGEGMAGSEKERREGDEARRDRFDEASERNSLCSLFFKKRH